VLFYMPTATPLIAGGEAAAGGGAEQQVLMLARELARRGRAVAIVAFDAGRPLPESVDGVDVVELRRPGLRLPLLRTAAFYARAFSTLRANPSPVLVQRAAGIHTTVAGVAAKLLRRRFVFASAGLHDFDFGVWEPKRWIVRAYRLGVQLADEVVVQTGEQVELCRRRLGREPVLIKSIAEPAPPQGAPPEAFLWIGKPIDHKRPLAYAELARALPQARFRMVVVDDLSPAGRELRAALERAAAELPNLELLAGRPRAELAPLFETAVAVVSTSLSEGMPNVFLEGWSRGVPALALAHDPDGVIERERVGGFAGGSGERLAELARELWEARANRRELAARCRGYVEREHAPASVADRWQALLGL
jgi:glycosyltransferase involved in cell wall biosynthesis